MNPEAYRKVSDSEEGGSGTRELLAALTEREEELVQEKQTIEDAMAAQEEAHPHIELFHGTMGDDAIRNDGSYADNGLRLAKVEKELAEVRERKGSLERPVETEPSGDRWEDLRYPSNH